MPRSVRAVSSPEPTTNHSEPPTASTFSHLLSPADPRAASATRPPLLHRSSSAPSPLLASALHPHEFVIPDIDLHLPFQSKHDGPGALRRIFIGPHIVGTAERTKGKDRAREPTEEEEGESSDAQSEGVSEPGSGKRERVKKTLKERRPRMDRHTSGESLGGPRVGGKKGVMHKWTGGSFEIGGDVREAVARRKEAVARREETMAALTPSTMGRESFITARTELDSAATTTGKVPSGDYRPKDPPARVEEALPELTHQLFRRPSDLASDTASLSDLPASPLPRKSILKSPTLLVNGQPEPLLANGSAPRNKSVQLPALRRSNTSPHLPTSRIPLDLLYPGPHSGDQPPPEVGDVLSRPVGDDFDDDVPIAFAPKARHGRHAVLKKERMLIRAEWTVREDLPDSFDEHSARKFPTQSEGWEEFAVVWRPGRIELWSEYTIPAASLFVGHKKLKHIIPLHQSRTKLSLYSSPDTIFCLAHRPLASSHAPLNTSNHDARAKKRHHFRPEGTNIYILRPRSSAIAKEWMWELYRELGGTIPSVLDISVPGLGVKIRLPVPQDLPPSPNDLARRGYQAVEEGLGEGYRLLKPDAVVKACVEQLSEVADWKQLIADNARDGVEIRLAWRRGEVLDWIPAGDECKDYAVVCGLALQQPNLETLLELRAALHYPTTVRLPATPSSPSKRLSEPPSIEGYLTRLKPSGATSERIYLSTHDGHLFLCRPSTAHAPDPPKPIQEGINNPATLVLAPFLLGFASMGGTRKSKAKLWERLTGRKDARKPQEEMLSEVEDPMVGLLERLEKEERKRALEQILVARGYVDLRTIVRVALVEETREEVEDVGGEDGLAAVEDKVALRRQRSFVLELTTGQSVQFECYSISVAAEWIGRLAALATYWSRRERVDAIEQMELQPVRRASRGLRSQRDVEREEDDLLSGTPLLGKMFHHCVLDECRSILRCGRFYVKRGLRGLFRERYIFLLPGGILLEYISKQRNVHGQATQVVYHRRSGILNLRGCYIYSGGLCSTVMGPNSNSGWDPADNAQRFPRIYSATDGLRTTDEDEDCTFVVWKKKAEQLRLDKSGNLRVFRARSKIERDEWVFALNSAIEKMQQGEGKAREESLKEFAWLSRT